MSKRMELAMNAADSLWEKALVVAPDFVYRYLELCEQLLLSKPTVTGDEYRAYCSRHGLIRPAVLDSRVWVSGPRSIAKLGWTERIELVEPVYLHNHMRSVTRWRSLIFGKGDDQ